MFEGQKVAHEDLLLVRLSMTAKFQFLTVNVMSVILAYIYAASFCIKFFFLSSSCCCEKKLLPFLQDLEF